MALRIQVKGSSLLFILLLVASLLGIAAADVGSHLAAIYLPPVVDREDTALRIELDRPTVSVDWELYNPFEGRRVVLLPKSGQDFPNVRIAVQYETSMGVEDEGPHLDLTDWKHYRSEWKDLKQLGEREFVLPTYTEEESSRFPEVSQREIYEAVLRYGDHRWAKLVKQVQHPNEYPASVGISTLRLGILVEEKGSWRRIHVIEFQIPMGC
jgi:hypothetical protein